MGHHTDADRNFQSDHKIKLQKNGTLKPNHIVLDFDDPAAQAALRVFAFTTDDVELGQDVYDRLAFMGVAEP